MSQPIQADNEDVFNRKIQLPKSKGTIYELLEIITERTDYLFIYDSDVLNNEQIVNIKKGNYTIREAIYTITGNRHLILRMIGNHILIRLPDEKKTIVEPKPIKKDTVPLFVTIEGTLVDHFTREPIPFASVGIPTDAIGTITNQNGDFRLRIPDSLKYSTIQFSHIGYITQSFDFSNLTGRANTLSLEPKVISIQEIVVRLVNPRRLIQDMLNKRDLNYPDQPVYLTTFYREGVERKKGFVNLTEAIFKIYKTPFDSPPLTDQVKMLKMRRITNEDERDTLVTKMKSGINASLMLDIVKNLPEFLSDEFIEHYDFRHTDIAVVDNRLANVIHFEQKKYLKEPLYQGELYIDNKNDALISARFEINPRYVEKAASLLVEKKSRNINIKPHKVTYTVSYKYWNGFYYINHVRGDLHFKVKMKKKLFSSTVHTWFEMVTAKIETQDVSRFTRNEVLRTRTIFSDTNFTYDEDFWENFNVIPPEEELSEAISKITSKIEETGY